MADQTKFSLSRAEHAVFALRALYEKHGYGRFRVSRFEEYDFYAGCKSFLKTENVLTFSDSTGRLMALKPDVTLSVLKNADGDGLKKVYYSESVYRDAGDGNGFREITQTGLECVGAVDGATVAETVRLAAESLSAISGGRAAVLTLSHMGVVSGLLGDADPAACEEIRGYMENKNAGGIRRAATAAGIGAERAEKLAALSSVYGSPNEVSASLDEICGGEPACEAALSELAAVGSSLGGGAKGMLKIDFSVAGDMNYYTGIVFRGFIDGIPKSVLSGGRYDGLLRGRGGIGFAVMTDLLEEYPGDGGEIYGTFLGEGEK